MDKPAPSPERLRWHKALLALLLGAAGSFFGFPAPAAATEIQTLELAGLDNPVQSAVAIAVLQEAYRRLGIVIRTHTLPLRRGIQMADTGELDGDLIHSAVSLNEWPHLLVVKVPVARAIFMAYRTGRICPARVSLDELTEGRVAYMRGTRGIELLLPEAALLASQNNWDALRAMRKGITRYAVTGQMESDAQLVGHGVHDVCKVREPVLTADLFHSLNERHAELAARLEHVLAEMSSKGDIARIWAAEGRRIGARLAAASAGSDR